MLPLRSAQWRLRPRSSTPFSLSVSRRARATGRLVVVTSTPKRCNIEAYLRQAFSAFSLISRQSATILLLLLVINSSKTRLLRLRSSELHIGLSNALRERLASGSVRTVIAPNPAAPLGVWSLTLCSSWPALWSNRNDDLYSANDTARKALQLGKLPPVDLPAITRRFRTKLILLHSATADRNRNYWASKYLIENF